MDFKITVYSGFLLAALFAVASVEALELSQHVIYKPGGNLVLKCVYSVSEPPSEDLYFIWHHNDSRLELDDPRPNQFDLSGEMKKYIYRLYIDKVTLNDSGTYACNVEGQAEAVSTTVKQVKVDESPEVAEMSTDVTLTFLHETQSGEHVRCFAAEDILTEIPRCVQKVYAIKERDIREYSAVIVSTQAMRHYGSIVNAFEHQVTFNTSRQLIGLQISMEEQNITIQLFGNDQVIQDMDVKCLEYSKPVQTNEETKVGSESEDQLVFTCQTDAVGSDIIVRIVKGHEILFEKKLGGQVSAAIQLQSYRPSSYLFILISGYLSVFHIRMCF